MPDDKKETLDVKDEKLFLKERLENHAEFQSGFEHVHKEYLDDMRMLINADGDGQWDPQVKAYREALVPPRPVLTQNMMTAFGEQVKNAQRQNRPQAKVNPVDDKADPDTALIIAGLIRNIQYQSNADAVHDGAFDTQTDGGIGTWRVVSEYADPMSFDQELRIRPIGSSLMSNPLSIGFDLSCRNHATSDKKWCYIDDVIRKEEAEQRWGKNKFATQSLPEVKGIQQAAWFMADGGVRIFEDWYIHERAAKIALLSNGEIVEVKDKDTIRNAIAKARQFFAGVKVLKERETTIPEVRMAICSGNEILEGPYRIPGMYIPIIITFGRVLNEEGRLHIKSLHRDAKQLQQVHNYLISSMVEQFALQPSVPWVGTKKMFEGLEEYWRSANNGGMSYLPYQVDPEAPGGRPTREAPPQVSGQLFNMIEMNLQYMRNVYGINKPAMGLDSTAKSGRAINALKLESDVSTLVFMSNHLLGLNFEANILIDQIPHYYDADRTVMITGLEGERRKVPLYRQVTGADGVPAVKQDGKPLIYDLKAGKYDVVVTMGPTAATQRDETAQLLGNMIPQISQTNPVAGQVLSLQLFKLLNLPDQDRLVKMITLTMPPEIRAVMEQENGGLPGQANPNQPNPQMAQMQAAFDAQMQQMVAQMQAQGATIEQLQAAGADLSGKLAAKEVEMQRAMDDLAMAKREIELEAKGAIQRSELKAGELLGQLQAYKAADQKAQELTREVTQIKMVVESMDRAMEAMITKSGSDDEKGALKDIRTSIEKMMVEWKSKPQEKPEQEKQNITVQNYIGAPVKKKVKLKELPNGAFEGEVEEVREPSDEAGE